MANSHLDRLHIIQRKATRIICQADSDSHAEPLLDSLGLKPLQDRRTKHVFKLVSEILSLNCHPSLVNMFLDNMSDAEGSELLVPSTRTLMGKKRFGVFGAEVFNRHLREI